MSLNLDYNYLPMFKGKVPPIKSKDISRVVEAVKPENISKIVETPLAKVPVAAMAAAAGVVMSQGNSDAVLDDVQVHNLKMCEEKQVSLPPTPENIVADIEEPVVVCGQRILGKDVDLTKVDFKSLLENFAKESTDGKMIVSTSDATQYEVSVKKDPLGENRMHIFIKPISNNLSKHVKYRISLKNEQPIYFVKRSLYDLDDIYTTFKEESYSFRKKIARLEYGDSRSKNKALYMFNDFDKIESIEKTRILYPADSDYDVSYAYDGPITHEKFDEEYPKNMFSAPWI